MIDVENVLESRAAVYTYNSSGIQFALQNDSADAIKANWKWSKTGSMSSH